MIAPAIIAAIIGGGTAVATSVVEWVKANPEKASQAAVRAASGGAKEVKRGVHSARNKRRARRRALGYRSE